MKKNLLNGLIVVAAAVVLVVFGTYVRVGATADAVVVLQTSGLRCSSCAGKVTEALQKQRGVVSTEVDLQGGCVVAGFDSKKVTPERLASTASAAGFGSTVRAVLTPAQFKAIVGREVGGADSGCGKGCCGNQKTAKKE